MNIDAILPIRYYMAGELGHWLGREGEGARKSMAFEGTVK